MTDDVSEIVLTDCYRPNSFTYQSLQLARCRSQLKEQIRFIHELERADKLDRGTRIYS